MPLISLGISASSGESIVPPRPQEHLYAVRAPLIPFAVIAGSDILPSPQRRSTGAVMGIASDPGVALSKALWSQGLRPQAGGKAFLSVANREKRRALLLARELMQAGYVLLATRGTAHALAAAGMEVETVNKLREGRPNILDLIRNGQVGMVVNIPRGKHPHSDGFYIRAASAHHGIPCITDMEVALALARGLRQAGPSAWELRPLQEYGRSRHEVREG
jgi:carbamoyl-phosphate synthase large subunit